MARNVALMLVSICLFPLLGVSASAQKKMHDWKGSIAAEAIVQSGNVDTQLFTLRGDISNVDSLIEVGLGGTFAYGEQDDIKNEQLLLGTLTVDLWPQDVLSPFVIGAAEYNFQRRIDLRWQTGVGAKWTFWEDSLNTVSFSPAVLFDATMYDPAAKLDDVRTGRGSVRLKGKHLLINSAVIFTHLSFFEPSLSNSKDYRWNTLLIFDIPVSKTVALRTSFNNTFENIVAEGKKKNDSKLLFGLKLSL